MRLLAVIAGFVIFAGCGGKSSVRVGERQPRETDKEFERTRVSGTTLFRNGEYRKAAKEFSAGAEKAGQAGEWLWQGRMLANEGGSYMMLGENRPAIRRLLAARTAAEKAGDLLTLQGVEGNLASIYVLTGDYEAAAAAAGRGAPIRPPKETPEYRTRTLIAFGRAMAKARGVEAAAPMWREALETAEGMGSESLAADVLELWGYELAEQDMARMGEAEESLARAWVKRKRARDGRLPLTEGKLARLYRKKGNTERARLWIDRTLAALAGGQRIPVAEWVLRAEEAQIASDEGRLEESLAGFRRAYGLVESWRRALPPAERMRLGAERRIEQDLVDGYLRTAGRLYRRRPQQRLAAEMFTLIQNTRAWSLEGGRGGRGAESPLYGEARRIEARWLAGDGAAVAELRKVRAAILEQEEAADSGKVGRGEGRLEEPADGEAVLTYWLSGEGSWLWVWTKQGLRMTSLPPQAEIEAAADAFRVAVECGSADAAAKGERLMGMLLGGARAESLRAERWEIVADEGLFRIPFAALPAGGGRYLVEKVELRLVPNALRQEPPGAAPRRFLAVADPIFNSADERRATAWFWQRQVQAAHFTADLPRLPGTRREAEAAREAMRRGGFETAVQSGAESSEEAVLARLAEWEPGVVHVATHTVTPANDRARPRLALSLRGDGSPGLLTAEDIAALPMRAELVVMSACHSTGTETARGAGLLGLTRAWLTAGSRQVMATLWPVEDEATALFRSFYERLAEGGAGKAAPALRAAQLACLRAGGRQAEPKNWAGHVLLGRR